MPIKVDALAKNTEGLLKLLGGSPDERLRFWEILKGITTPAVMRLVQTQIDATAAQMQGVQALAKTLKADVKELSRG